MSDQNVKTIDRHAAMRDAGAACNRGNGALRNEITRVKADVGLHTGDEGTAVQLSQLREFRVDAYIGAMADHLAKGAKPTAAQLAQATTLVTVTKGFSTQAKDTDSRRTQAQENVMGRMRKAWSDAAKDIGLPALDGRGGANKGEAKVKEGEVAESKGKVASFGFTKTTAPPVFAEGLAALCTRYIAEQGVNLTGDYAAFIRHVVDDVAALRGKVQG